MRSCCCFIVGGIIALLGQKAYSRPVINEIMFHPPAVDGREDVTKEYLEIKNIGEEPLDLANHSITGGVDFIFPPGNVLPPGAFAVVCRDRDAFIATHGAIPNLFGNWSGRLSNASERIRLRTPNGEVVDEVTYFDEGDWANRVRGDQNQGFAWQNHADGSGASLELINPELPNEFGQNWRALSRNTSPGAENKAAANQSAPLILDVSHHPALPGSTDPIFVNARLIGRNGIPVTSLLHWRTDSERPFQTVPMEARDSDLHEGIIPPQIDRSIIEFYVESSSGGQTRTWPAPLPGFDFTERQIVNAHVGVSDTAKLPGTYHFWITAEDQRAFDSWSRDSNGQANVTVVAIDDSGQPEIRYRCGVRRRGNSSRSFNPVPRRLNLPRDSPLKGLSRLNFNTRNPHNQVLGFAFFKEARLPAPLATLTSFTINGEEISSVAVVEPLNGEFVGNHFNGDSGGNLYKKRSAHPNRESKNWGVHNNGSTPVYTRPNWYRTDQFAKGNNASANDWSDLQNFVETMHASHFLTYIENVEKVAHLDQWMKWFAMMTILNNEETNLSSGIDDDYSLYFGREDPRMILLPHDLDTLFSSPTDSLFKMERVPQLQRLMDHRGIRQLYYAALRELLDTVFSPERAGTILETHLSGTDFENRLPGILTFLQSRREFIDRTLLKTPAPDTRFQEDTITTVTGDRFNLTGTIDPTTTHRVHINGRRATLDRKTGTWTLSFPLHPGLNRLQTVFEDPEGREHPPVESLVWFENNRRTPLAGTLTLDRTLLPETGPYLVNGTFTVPAGRTLTIAPGTTVLFGPSARLRIKGSLKADGEAGDRIQFTVDPAAPLEPDIRPGLPPAPPRWNGVQFVDSISDENRLAYLDIRHAQNAGGSVGFIRSFAHLDHVTIADTHLPMVSLRDSSAAINACRFAPMFGHDEDPAALELNNVSHHIKSIGAFPADRPLTITGSWFGANRGRNHCLDIESGARPGPILHLSGNTFEGSEADLVKVSGEALISENLFQDVHKGGANTNRAYASAISVTSNDSDATIAVANNVFVRCDHAIHLGGGAVCLFENNTVIDTPDDFTDATGFVHRTGAISFYHDESETGPGRGAYAANNVFSSASRIFTNVDSAGSASLLYLQHNLIDPVTANRVMEGREGGLADFGDSQVIGEARFLDGYTLAPDSPGLGSALPSGNLGVGLNQPLLVHGLPAETTMSSELHLRVSGAGLDAFRWKLNDGEWSDVIILETTLGADQPPGRVHDLSLTNLPAGEQTLLLQGRDFSGTWIEPPLSRTWTIDPNHVGNVRLNEILASNNGGVPWENAFPDLIELHNADSTPINLGGYRLTDDPEARDKYVFPANTRIEPGGFLVVDNRDDGPGFPFGLDANGEALFLYSPNGDLIDQVSWSFQIPNLSIGRDTNGIWALNAPTPGSGNRIQPTGSPDQVRINEILANSESIFREDFIELHNHGDLPIHLEGLTLTDKRWGNLQDGRTFAPLTFLPAIGYRVLQASGAAAPDALPFRLSSAFESVVLLDPSGRVIDEMTVENSINDRSIGRFPDGTGPVVATRFATPGEPNTPPEERLETVIGSVIPWRYLESEPPGDWTVTDFDHGTWESGFSLFASESMSGDLPVWTSFPQAPTTLYLRHPFSLPSLDPDTGLELVVEVNDGCAVYMDGRELGRINLPEGPLTSATLAQTSLGDETLTATFPVPRDLLGNGSH
ncbi:MAG: lamin tail domain-containing protein, partial [Verrucomicrobiota bacterium]